MASENHKGSSPLRSPPVILPDVSGMQVSTPNMPEAGGVVRIHDHATCRRSLVIIHNSRLSPGGKSQETLLVTSVAGLKFLHVMSYQIALKWSCSLPLCTNFHPFPVFLCFSPSITYGERESSFFLNNIRIFLSRCRRNQNLGSLPAVRGLDDLLECSLTSAASHHRVPKRAACSLQTSPQP